LLLHPAYKLTIGDKIVDTTDEPQASPAISLTVALDMGTPADSFTLLLGQVGGFQPRRDDEAKIELGFRDGELTQVMVGQVVTADSGLTRRRITGHSPARKLLNTFTSQTYESKTAGQVVSDLADQTGISVARAEDGITFPAYVIDGRCSFYHHMRVLADLCGFDLYINADGELVFARFQRGNAIHIFDYAKQIIELDLLQTPPISGEVLAWGESPGSGKGEESWAWLTKDFDGRKGSAGSGSPVQLLERPALRTAEAARAAANAAHTHLTRQTLRGFLLSTGQPKVKLGDAIQLRNLPDGGANGTYQVRSVTHNLDKSDGFTTRIGFRAI
jgi:phage protein D